jgi:hypothetical protein
MSWNYDPPSRRPTAVPAARRRPALLERLRYRFRRPAGLAYLESVREFERGKDSARLG